MRQEERDILTGLLRDRRILALGVVVDGEPYVGLLPFVADPDLRSLLIHASGLARHSRGLTSGARCSLMIHAGESAIADPLQVPRATINASVEVLDRSDPAYPAAREHFINRFPTAEPTFSLGDFTLYRLRFGSGRLVGGFARAVNLSPASFTDLT